MSTSIDHHLGPATGRYFGEGFKRVGHALGDLAVDRDGVRGRAAVTYPMDWSRKAAGSPPPHLSTIDALVLAVQLAEIHLAHVHALTPEQRRHLWLRSFDMRAGVAPQERLDDLAAEARHAGDEGTTTAYACRVGAIRVDCRIERGAHAHVRGPAVYATAEDILGPPARRYYGEGFKARSHRIDDVRSLQDGECVTAAITLSDRDGSPDQGLGGAHQPAIALLDCFISLAQLAQVLAYGLDGLDRGTSDTLWMRRLALTADAPRQPPDERFPGRVSLLRTRRLPLDGASWRSFELLGGFPGIQARASMAHRLPTQTERRLAA